MKSDKTDKSYERQLISIVVFTAALSVITFILGWIGFREINNAYRSEIAMVQNIAGAVISEYPETEITFIAAVGDTGQSSRRDGAELLSRYGYDENRELKHNVSYKKALYSYFAVLIVFFIGVIFCGYVFFFSVVKIRKKQEKQILLLLDRCLADDYRFLADEQQLAEFCNPLFADHFKKLGECLRLKTELLAEEQDHTKTLVTDISHQLKTPISALQTCFSMYLEADSQREQEEFLSRCRVQMDKLESLTSSLINISRLESAMITLQTESVSLTDIIIEAVNTVYHKALKKDIHIETADFEDINLQLDKKWTVEAMANILDNGIKYSPRKSTIFIRVQKLFSFVRIEIEDRGIGITKEEQNKIFRRFYRGEHPVVKDQEGSGVGLYLVRKILEDEGGTVSVSAAREGGSIFIVQLPL